MKASHPQGLIHIDIAQSRKKSLIQQEGFQLPAPRKQALPEPVLSKVILERFRTQAAQHPFRVADQGPSPEFTRIHKLQPPSVIQLQGQTCRGMATAPRFKINPSAHPQMRKKGITVVQDENQIFRAAPYGQDPAPADSPDKSLTVSRPHHSRPAQRHLAYPATGNPPPAQITDNGFNLRQFRHGVLPSNPAAAAPFHAVLARRAKGGAASPRHDLRGIPPGDPETQTAFPAASSLPGTHG